MKKLFLLTLLLYGCSPMGLKVADDIIEGEAATAEKIVHDLQAPDPIKGKQRPATEIKVPLKKF